MAADSRLDLNESTASNETNRAEGASQSVESGENLSGGMSEKTVGRLKFASGVMGILIILCLVLLVYGVSQKAGELSSSKDAPQSVVAAQSISPQDLPTTLSLPAGMKVVSIAPATDGGLWLFTRLEGAPYLVRIDMFGQLVQTVQITSAE